MKNILIVEDESIIAANLASQLSGIGYSIAGVTDNGEDAIEKTRHLQPDLVVMDIQLAGQLDGIQAARAIKAEMDIPLVYLTAHSDSATLARVKASDVDGYILKPFEARELTTQIELALYKHNANRKLRESESRYRSLFQDNHDVLLLLDPDQGEIVDANPAACEFYGYPLDAMTRLTAADINTLEADRINDEINAAMSDGKRHFFFRHRLADGDIRDVEVFSGPIVVDGRELLYSIVHDITERRKAENALHCLNETLEQKVAERTRLAEARAARVQHLAGELFQAEERERRRIARLLHDDLQQILAASKLQLEVACANLAPSEELAKVDSWLASAIRKTRSLSCALGPGTFKNGTLADTVQTVANQMETQFGL